MGSVFPVRPSAPTVCVLCCEIQHYVCHMFPASAAHELMQKVGPSLFFVESFIIYDDHLYIVPRDFPTRFHNISENTCSFVFLVSHCALSGNEKTGRSKGERKDMTCRKVVAQMYKLFLSILSPKYYLLSLRICLSFSFITAPLNSVQHVTYICSSTTG